MVGWKVIWLWMALFTVVVQCHKTASNEEDDDDDDDGDNNVLSIDGQVFRWDRRDFQPLPADPEAYMTSPEIIRNRGYQVEIHHVTTDDGYILELHRIPPSIKNGTHNYSNGSRKSVGQGRPVFLQHGVFSSSVCWLINPSQRSLAFRLADLGYDVWMGNTRGNIYSRRHAWLDPTDPEFWQFSWDEIGTYDIPACMHYVLEKSGWNKLIYVGHSLGTGVFFIAMIQHPELNLLVHKMIALAPITTKANLRSPFRYVAPFIQPFAYVMDKVQTGPIFDMDHTLRALQKSVCERNFHKASFCRDFLFKIGGANPQHFDLNLLPSVNAHLFQGTSLRAIAQFAQHYNTGREVFQRYDYGRRGNLERYGTPEPPAYDLSQVTCPVYIYFGLNDLISTAEDSRWAAGQLGNVRGFYQVDDDQFNHWDFLWSVNVNAVLYDHLIPLFR